MNYFQLKTLLAVLIVAAGLTAALSMLSLMGRSERRMSPAALRKTHVVSGYIFCVLLAVLAVMGLRHLGLVGDAISFRGVLHWVLASLLVFLLLLKLVVVRFYRQFLKFVPVMGMAAITLTFVVVTVSAVFFAVAGLPTSAVSGPDGSGVAEALSTEEIVVRAPEQQPDALERQAVHGNSSAGLILFENHCTHCHYAESDTRKIGPGLAGLFSWDVLDVNGKPVTPASVREQLVSPVGKMPSFRSRLSEGELDDLISYLQTL
jgi:mono/diheme cytochrome c family protein